MDYCLDAGDGTASIWTGPHNADLDADGLLDVNRDGLADRALGTDGSSTTGYVDTDGDGRWDVRLVDTDGDGSADGAGGL